VSRGASLIEAVQGLLERTYRMRSGVERIGRYVIGDGGFRILYGDAEAEMIATGDASGARTLVRETTEGLRACIYYPNELIRTLEAAPPQRGLSDENVDAFATLVEELDHLLLIAERSLQDRPLTLFELELHANVSKHLVLQRFLAGGGRRLDDARRVWLQHHLFGKVSFCDRDPEVRARYREAARWAVRFLETLPGQAAARRLDLLRRFHRAGAAGKLDLIRRVAA
jgi:hypothetical protein